MSGELSEAITRGAFSTITVNWSSRMLNLTFECCLENSSANALASGKPVSAYISRVIGSVPSSVLTAASDFWVDDRSSPGALQAVAVIPTASSDARSTVLRRGNFVSNSAIS